MLKNLLDTDLPKINCEYHRTSRRLTKITLHISAQTNRMKNKFHAPCLLPAVNPRRIVSQLLLQGNRCVQLDRRSSGRSLATVPSRNCTTMRGPYGIFSPPEIMATCMRFAKRSENTTQKRETSKKAIRVNSSIFL